MKNKIVYIIPFLLLFVGLYCMPLAVFETNLNKMPGDLGDTRFNNYVLEHGYKYFTGKVDSFWDGPFLYPYKNVIALSDNLLGTLPIYSLFRGVGADRETAFQLWLLALFGLNFICCFIALNNWSKNVILSSVGAYIFSFSIYNIGQLDHVQVFPKFIAPLVLYWCWKFISERKIKYFLFTALGLVYQFYCGMYLAFILAYVLLFMCISYFAVYRDRLFFHSFRNKKALIGLAAILLLSIALLSPLVKPYLDVADKMGMRKFENAFNTIPKPISYFFAPESSIVWRFLSHPCLDRFPDWWSHRLFFGAIPWLGFIAGIYVLLSKRISKENKKRIYFILLSVFLCVLFCLNIQGVTLYRIIFALPGFSSMRSIDRFINMEIILFILLFVFAFKILNDNYSKTKYFIFCLPIFVVIDNSYDATKVKRFDKVVSQLRIAKVKEQIAERYDPKYSAIAYMKYLNYVDDGTDGYINTVATQLDVMTASQELSIPCVNSYTGFDPGNYPDFLFEPRDKTLSNWCDFNHFDYSKIQHINDLGKKEVSREKINLVAYNNKYVTAIQGDEEPLIYANREVADDWERFIIVRFDNDDCFLKASTNLLWCAELDRQGIMNSSRKKPAEWETFHRIELNDSTIAFRAANGLYLSVDPSSLILFARSKEIGVREAFKIIKF